jgi:hypothetical protein
MPKKPENMEQTESESGESTVISCPEKALAKAGPTQEVGNRLMARHSMIYVLFKVLVNRCHCSMDGANQGLIQVRARQPPRTSIL